MHPTIPRAERRRLLARSPLFQVLPPADLDLLAERAAERRYANGQSVFGRGEPGSCMLAVAEGRVRLGRTTAEGREVLLAILGPGEVFGELALLDGGPRSADATAVGDCVLLLLDRRDLLPAIRRSPEAEARLFEIVCGRLRATTERLEGAAAMPVAARLARLLLTLANDIDAQVAADLSQGDLGRLAGASRQKVNLHLGRWADEGLLARDGRRLVVLDRERLSEIAEVSNDDADAGSDDAGSAQRKTRACHPGDKSRSRTAVNHGA